MFIINVRHCIYLITLIRPTMSNFLTPDSSGDPFSSGLSSYSSEISSESLSSYVDGLDDANVFNWLDNDGAPSIFDEIYFLPTQSNGDNPDLITSESEDSCSLGKKRSGESCGARQDLLPPLQLPNLLEGDGEDSSATILQGEQQKRCPGGWHLCCDGPTLQGTEAILYISIHNCVEGTIKI